MEARLFKAFRQVVDRITSRMDFHATYAGTVLKCHGDGHLDVQPDSANLPQFTRLPIRLPWPGVSTLKVKPGARVLIAFEGGNPERPHVVHFETGTLEHLLISTGEGLTIELNDDRDGGYSTPTIKVTDGASRVQMQPKQLVMHIHAAGDAQITAAGKIKLAGGGPAVARVGDTVQVGSNTGTITGGSGNVEAG